MLVACRFVVTTFKQIELVESVKNKILYLIKQYTHFIHLSRRFNSIMRFSDPRALPPNIVIERTETYRRVVYTGDGPLKKGTRWSFPTTDSRTSSRDNITMYNVHGGNNLSVRGWADMIRSTPNDVAPNCAFVLERNGTVTLEIINDVQPSGELLYPAYGRVLHDDDSPVPSYSSVSYSKSSNVLPKWKNNAPLPKTTRKWKSAMRQIKGNPITEDAVYTIDSDPFVAVICDGHGGTEASTFAVKFIADGLAELPRPLKSQAIKQLFKTCDQKLLAMTKTGEIPIGRGTTCAFVTQSSDHDVVIGTIGDSSVMMCRHGMQKDDFAYFEGASRATHIALDGGVNMPTALGDWHLKLRDMYATYCESSKGDVDLWPAGRTKPFLGDEVLLHRVPISSTEPLTFILGTDGFFGSKGERILTKCSRFKINGVNGISQTLRENTKWDPKTKGVVVDEQMLVAQLMYDAMHVWWNLYAKDEGISWEAFAMDETIWEKLELDERNYHDDISAIVVTNRSADSLLLRDKLE